MKQKDEEEQEKEEGEESKAEVNWRAERSIGFSS